MKNILVIAIIVGLAWVGYGKLKAAPPSVVATEFVPPHTQDSPRSESRPTSASKASSFKCDGRTHCSQMTSCAEATYFIQHCPNTQMDGNNDGEPCEQQWCK